MINAQTASGPAPGAVTLNPAFFAHIKPMFGGHLEQSQVDGINSIVGAWNKWAPANHDLQPNIRWLAYGGLATPFHETGRTMQPVEEAGKGKGRDYGHPDTMTGQIYYGRGLIQLTWKANYQVQGVRLGIDLENNPDLALKSDIAADIMLNGMAHGQFTGRRLGQYFGTNPANDNPLGARAIINGHDKADTVAAYHRTFLEALHLCGAA